MAVERIKPTEDKKPIASDKPLTKKDSSMADSIKEDLKDPHDKHSSADEIFDDDGDIIPEDKKLTSKQMIAIGIGVGLVVIVGLIIFIIANKKPVELPPAPMVSEEPTIDYDAIEKQRLYEAGIGKEFIDELNIYEQGNLENSQFRKDFLNEDQKEKFELPIRIQNVNDSISYIKHRVLMGDGVEMYYLEGNYKGRNCILTISYSIYQSIADEGTIDVIVEVVSDKTGSTTVTSIQAVPPSKRK